MGKRYSIRDILVAICEPSHSISEQYQASVITLKNGSSVYGRVIYKNKKELAVATTAFNPSVIQKIPADQVQTVKPSNISLMPSGTINGMNKEELANLMAYLLSGGNRRHKAFVNK